MTPPTTCNDGSTSQSTGSGTCSHHDGIAFSNDKLGDGNGLDALVGVSVWFGRPSRRPKPASPPPVTSQPPDRWASEGSAPDTPELTVECSLDQVTGYVFRHDSNWILKIENKTDTPVIVYWSESNIEVDGFDEGHLRIGADDASDPIPSLGELRVEIGTDGYHLGDLRGHRSAKIHLTVRAVPEERSD